MPGHLPDTEERGLRERLLDPPHQAEVLLSLVLGRVVERRTRDRQQLALLADRQIRVVRRDHAAPHCPPQGFSFRSQKELATAFSRSLEHIAFAASPRDLGVELLHLLLVNLRLLAAPALEHD